MDAFNQNLISDTRDPNEIYQLLKRIGEGFVP